MQHQKIVYKLSWSFSKTYRIDFHELVCVAQEAYFLALRNYDPVRKASQSSVIWIYIQNALIDYCTNEKKQSQIKATIPFPEKSSDAQSYEYQANMQFPLPTRFLELSVEAQQVCKIIFEAPEEFLTSTAKTARAAMESYLHSKKGWPYARIEGTFKEIRMFLQSL